MVRRALRAVVSHPFTLVVACTLIIVGCVTGLMHGPNHNVQGWAAAGLRPLILRGHWWSLLTSSFFTNNAIDLVVALASVIAFVGISERVMGSARTALAFFTTAAVGSGVGVLIQLLGDRGGELWSRDAVGILSLDPLTAVAGTIMTASAFTSPLLRRRIRIITALIALVFMLYSGQPSDLYRLLAVIAGFILGILLAGRARGAGWVRSSHHEVRVLMASVIAITAIGPVIALLTASRFGPLAPIRMLFTNAVPSAASVAARCQVYDLTRECIREFALVRISSPGPILLAILPLALLLLTAYGLLHGSRFALWLAVLVNGLLAVLAAYYFGFLRIARVAGGSPARVPHSFEIILSLAISVLLPLGIAVVLIVLRSHFPVLASAELIRRYVLIMVTTAIVLALFYIVTGFVLRESAFTRTISEDDLLGDVVERFVPINFLVHSVPGFLPTTFFARLVYSGVGPVFWMVAIIAAIRPLREYERKAAGGEVARARSLLTEGGGDTLGFMTTWPGNVYWFDTATDVCVAYRVVHGVALTIGGPFGSSRVDEGTVARFARFCDDNGWIPVFYSVQERLAPTFRSMGWETIVVADETVINPQNWSLEGRKWQDVRTAINRAARSGIRAEWTTYAELSRPVASQIAEISEQWVAQRDLPEMGFTLGGFEELRDRAVRLMVAIDTDEQVQAVTSWLPTYRDGRVVAWTLDVMRRRSDSANGVMEFLIAQTAMRLRDDGIETMSLSGTPLARTSEDENSPRNTVLDYLSASLEPIYGFQSLLRFKRKFQPESRPLLMAYPDPVSLPLIGVALARAYLPDLSLGRAAALLRSHR